VERFVTSRSSRFKAGHWKRVDVIYDFRAIVGDRTTRIFNMDSPRMLCLFEDHLNHSEVSHGYLSPVLSKCELFFPTSEYFPSSCSLMSAFPGEELDDSDLDFPGKRPDETGKESELSQTFEETNRAQSTCRNNVSPAIQKIMRMMRLTPCLSTTLTKRALSAGRLDHLDDSLRNLKRRLDASFTPDVAFRRHSMDGRLLETRESDSSISTRRSCDFTDALANDEFAVASVSHREIKRSPACVQIVATTDQASAEDYNYVSESYFLLMTSSRNQRMKNEASRERP